jgi:hypothetical protein
MFDALQKLFAETRVRREEAPYVVCRLQPGTPLERVVQLQPPPLCVCVEPDGATVFLPQAELAALEAAVPVAEHDGPWTVFGLYAPFDFGVTGYLARVCDVLAAREIPVLSLATYRRDFLLVPGARADEAERALDGLILGGELGRGSGGTGLRG